MPEGGADFLVVHLSTLVVPDDMSTLMAIAAQLGLTAQVRKCVHADIYIYRYIQIDT